MRDFFIIGKKFLTACEETDCGEERLISLLRTFESDVTREKERGLESALKV